MRLSSSGFMASRNIGLVTTSQIGFSFTASLAARVGCGKSTVGKHRHKHKKILKIDIGITKRLIGISSEM